MNDNFTPSSSHFELPLLMPKSAPSMALDSDRLAQIKKRLEALPTVAVMTTKSAITALLPTVKKLQGRGYTVEQISAELKASGLPTSTRSLARILSTKRPSAAVPQANN